MSSNLSIKAFFDSSSIPLSFMFSLRFAVSGEQLFVVTQDKRMEFKKDPVQFVIDNNDEVKELVDQLDDTENQQALQSEIRETISSAIGMHSNRMLTNAEIDDISTTDDYKEQLAKIKQVISEKGKTVVDELMVNQLFNFIVVINHELNRVFLKLHSFVVVISSKYVISS
jgi:type II secretory ATPase GspE/PulE/Tfp pilus assembly ATPase PilB-like protein